MTDNAKTSVQIGPGFLGILTLIFITLKLTGYIAWSWLWVLSPIWLPILIMLGIFGIVLVIMGIVALLQR